MKISKYLLAAMFSSFVLSACASTPTDDTTVTDGDAAAVEDTMVKDDAAVVNDDAAMKDDAIKIEVGGDAAAKDDGALE
jgi:hypothetical protein